MPQALLTQAVKENASDIHIEPYPGKAKTEIRFRPTEDGKLVPETTNDIKMKPSK